jgi:hypothetical protein
LQENWIIPMMIRSLLALVPLLAPLAVGAQTPAIHPETWPVLTNPFPSTSGDGTMIDGYAPIVIGTTCQSPFIAVLPDGQRLSHTIMFDAEPLLGGIHCRNGRWKSKDGKNSGTTPFELFIKDGQIRRKPNA